MIAQAKPAPRETGRVFSIIIRGSSSPRKHASFFTSKQIPLSEGLQLLYVGRDFTHQIRLYTWQQDPRTSSPSRGTRSSAPVSAARTSARPAPSLAGVHRFPQRTPWQLDELRSLELNIIYNSQASPSTLHFQVPRAKDDMGWRKRTRLCGTKCAPNYLNGTLYLS